MEDVEIFVGVEHRDELALILERVEAVGFKARSTDDIHGGLIGWIPRDKVEDLRGIRGVFSVEFLIDEDPLAV
jgi:hypothetical protein